MYREKPHWIILKELAGNNGCKSTDNGFLLCYNSLFFPMTFAHIDISTDSTTIKFISQFENIKGHSYSWKPDAGRWFPYKESTGSAIGYGTQLHDTRFSDTERKRFRAKGITDREAIGFVGDRVRKDRGRLEKFAGKPLKEFLTKDQETAVLSYIYNVGFNTRWKFAKNLKRVAKSKNKKEHERFLQQTVDEMNINTIHGVKSEGLAARRAVERKLFNSYLDNNR